MAQINPKTFDPEDAAFGVFLLSWLALAVFDYPKPFAAAGLVGIAAYVLFTVVLLIVRRNDRDDDAK